MKLGCHVGNSGDEMLLGSVKEALSYKANCFMIYLGAPQNTYRKEVERLNIQGMHDILKENDINPEDIIVHAPYIVNLAQSDEVKRKFAVDFITKEIKTTALIGAKYIVIHPGAHVQMGEDVGLNKIIESVKEILDNTKDTNVFIALETMAGKGTELCYKFEHIKYILDEVKSDRLVVCYDTCHTSDAGYDYVNDYEGVLNKFDELIGLDKIKVIHLNDSKNELGARKDRHENFGFGKIGFEALMQFVNDKRFENIPKILETPYVQSDKKDYPPYKYEIEMIKSGVFDQNLLDKIEKGE
jgi:deoxyribonuclease-4